MVIRHFFLYAFLVLLVWQSVIPACGPRCCSESQSSSQSLSHDKSPNPESPLPHQQCSECLCSVCGCALPGSPVSVSLFTDPSSVPQFVQQIYHYLPSSGLFRPPQPIFHSLT